MKKIQSINFLKHLPFLYYTWKADHITAKKRHYIKLGHVLEDFKAYYLIPSAFVIRCSGIYFTFILFIYYYESIKRDEIYVWERIQILNYRCSFWYNRKVCVCVCVCVLLQYNRKVCACSGVYLTVLHMSSTLLPG